MIEFERYPHRCGVYREISERALKLAENKPERLAKKHRKALPLLAEQIEGGKVQDFNVALEIRIRNERDDSSTRSKRQFLARCWIEARRKYFACSPEVQESIKQKWKDLQHMPKTAVYFASMVDGLSGEREKRVAKCEAEYQAWKEKQKKIMGEQLTLI